jgi:isoleucyl-tRNA synthetase
MQEILDVMVRLMAPILSFTADEIWQYRAGLINLQASIQASLSP